MTKFKIGDRFRPDNFIGTNKYYSIRDIVSESLSYTIDYHNEDGRIITISCAIEVIDEHYKVLTNPDTDYDESDYREDDV